MTDTATLTGLLVLAILVVFVVTVATTAIVGLLARERGRPDRAEPLDHARDHTQDQAPDRTLAQALARRGPILRR